MSSFRKGKSERLYTLSRRELQALCKQYGIPTNKSNVAMADALAACVPVDTAKPKAWAGAHSFRVSKTTPSKGDGGAETPLMSFTSSGKRKVSPVKMGEGRGALKRDTTPLRRGIKRSERPLIQTPREENSKAALNPAFSRAAALLDRFGKSMAATSSFRAQAPTPGKRPGITRRGGEALQPVSCTEIEFRNAALHKELFGGHTEAQEGHDFTPVERGQYPSESSLEIGFEFRDMALHKELFGANPGSSTAHAMVPSVFISPLTSSPEILDYSGHEIRVLSSIREEDAGDESGKEYQRQGRDLGPLLDDMSCDSPASSLSRVEGDLPVPMNIQNSPLVEEASPLTKIRNNIGRTLTKATSVLEKLTSMRADAEKKRREGYWEPKFSSPVAVFQTALVVDRDLPSAKKARLTPKALSSSETGFVVCEDANVSSKGETPAKNICIQDGSRDVMPDKENQDWNSRKMGSLGKEKKSRQLDVLKDRPKNVSDHVNSEAGSIKPFLGEIRPEEMSLRKLRAQFKERIRHLEASKASDLRPWSERVV